MLHPQHSRHLRPHKDFDVGPAEPAVHGLIPKAALELRVLGHPLRDLSVVQEFFTLKLFNITILLPLLFHSAISFNFWPKY
jgi:hypothetical protein